ncbi:MAG: DUF1460 domain-containing protein [Fimbriimonadaceae bacterium]|nr:MAG: DUF1460 domain-containing protein [Fimbriimonadaceae bacterium]
MVSCVLLTVLVSGSSNAFFASDMNYTKLADKAVSQNWTFMTTTERIVVVGREFLGTPYVAWTLESHPEKCSVFLDGLDCVTFLESSWAIAKCSPKISANSVLAEVTKTRYREGRVDGYFSRYHYTSDWLMGNQKAGRLKIVSEEFTGGIDWNPTTNYMSRNPEKYKASTYVEDFVKGCQAMENSLSSIRFKRIPKDKWQSVLSKMRPGDFIALCTTIDGLDFSHVGIYTGNGKFLHASSSNKQVVEQDLLEWGRAVRTCNGMVVSRAV